jgi:hypothetical protein
MIPGDSVEVNQVWASNGYLKAPERAWFEGYVLEAIVGKIAKVKHTTGLYAGCVINQPLENVRPATKWRE